MKAFSHVGNTWLLAQLFHPLIFFICFSFLWHETPEVGVLISLLIGAAVLSLPALLLCFLFAQIVPIARLSVVANFLVWIVLVLTALVINISLLAALVGDAELLVHEINFFLPAFIAAIMSMLLRLRNFKNFLNLQKANEEDQYDIDDSY